MQVMQRLFLCALGLAPVSFAARVGPFSVAGEDLVALGGEVDVYFVGSDATFDSNLRLIAPHNLGPFFPNHATVPGAKATLGTFASETVLIFALDVRNTGDSFLYGTSFTKSR
jgi:hypothetical protein